MKNAFALFDFDGTLARGDSIVPYIDFCIDIGLVPATQWLKAFYGYCQQRLHPQKIAASKAKALSFIRGHSREEMDQIARQFFHERYQSRIYQQGVAEIKALMRQGWRVLVISASAEVYMRVLPEFLPVEAVLCTQCEIDSKGYYTGIISENCRGNVKVQRYLAWMKERQLSSDRLRCYGDSSGDIEMLSMASQPVLVHPKNSLRKAFPNAQVFTWK